MPLPTQGGVQSWILVITELHRYQGVGYKSDIVVISGNHYTIICTPRGTISLLTYSSHKCNRDSNQSLFPLRTTRKQGLFSESIAKLFLVFNAFWSQLLSCVLVDILMNQFAETLNLNQPQECLDNILISFLFLCQV